MPLLPDYSTDALGKSIPSPKSSSGRRGTSSDSPNASPLAESVRVEQLSVKALLFDRRCLPRQANSRGRLIEPEPSEGTDDVISTTTRSVNGSTTNRETTRRRRA